MTYLLEATIYVTLEDAGVQSLLKILDSGFRRNDDEKRVLDLYYNVKY